MPDAPIFTPPELAMRWRCRPEGVRDLLEADLLRGFKIGKSHWRITLEAVLAYERGERPEPRPAAPRRRRQELVEIPEGPF